MPADIGAVGLRHCVYYYSFDLSHLNAAKRREGIIRERSTMFQQEALFRLPTYLLLWD